MNEGILGILLVAFIIYAMLKSKKKRKKTSWYRTDDGQWMVEQHDDFDVGDDGGCD